MKEVRDAIAKILETATVADLVTRAEQLSQEPNRPIDFEI
jgi:DNA-binding IscR family transcriptional regulator